MMYENCYQFDKDNRWIRFELYLEGVTLSLAKLAKLTTAKYHLSNMLNFKMYRFTHNSRYSIWTYQTDIRKPVQWLLNHKGELSSSVGLWDLWWHRVAPYYSGSQCRGQIQKYQEEGFHPARQMVPGMNRRAGWVHESALWGNECSRVGGVAENCW